jgi:hypothetical protein
LTATKDENGCVTMFFLLIPALSALISFVLSRWIPGLRFVPGGCFCRHGSGDDLALLIVDDFLARRAGR